MEFIKNFIDSLKNNDAGFAQRKINIAGIMTTIMIGNIAYIGNCIYRNLFDSTYILWNGTMIGFISSMLIALYGTKAKPKDEL